LFFVFLAAVILTALCGCRSGNPKPDSTLIVEIKLHYRTKSTRYFNYYLK